MNRVQIAILKDEGDGRRRWRFAAHGAPYHRADAARFIEIYGKSRVRLLPLPKGQ